MYCVIIIAQLGVIIKGMEYVSDRVNLGFRRTMILTAHRVEEYNALMYSFSPDGKNEMKRGRAMNRVVSRAGCAIPSEGKFGCFYSFTAEKPFYQTGFELRLSCEIQNFLAAYRYDPYWMTPRTGTALSDVPPETQQLLLLLKDGSYAYLLPLLDQKVRSSLYVKDGELSLYAETGDDAVRVTSFIGLYIACGDDPYTLMSNALAEVAERVGGFRLKKDKAKPDYLDGIGWCSYNACHKDFSPAAVLEHVGDLHKLGVKVKYLLLDAGWQDVALGSTGEGCLQSFGANDQFDGDLRGLIEKVKGDFDVTRFIVWLSVVGSHHGIDPEKFKEYGVHTVVPKYYGLMPEIEPYFADNAPAMRPFALPASEEDAMRFYFDYCQTLYNEGVDGIKIDTQCLLEGLGRGFGGRVALTKAYRRAMESAAAYWFNGNLISCMAMGNDVALSAFSGNTIRSFDDFWPYWPVRQGLLVFANAVNSLFLRDIFHCDWDMFESAHPQGRFHAAARAISGSPVCLTDHAGEHDMDVINKLVFSDGSVPRFENAAIPTRDSLFIDAVNDRALLKIFNAQNGFGAVGVFNCRYNSEIGKKHGEPWSCVSDPVTANVYPRDVEGLLGEKFAMYRHFEDTLTSHAASEPLEITLDCHTCEIVTVSPVIDGFAPIGLIDKYNSCMTMTGYVRESSGTAVVILKGGGIFAAYSEAEPVAVRLNGGEWPFRYDANRLDVDLTSVKEAAKVEIVFR